MLLSDMGASVVRIDRAGGNGWENPIVDRGRATIGVDIKSAAGKAFSLEAAEYADVLIEGLRPGVMERLGLGPDVLLARNPRLVYGRVTGWGQTGPLAKAAGHDINYIAITGALAAIGRKGEPAVPPLNLVGDFGGGSMFLAFGIMAALWERERSGLGQVVDAAMVDGVTHLMSAFAGLLPGGRISVERDQSLLGGAAPFYRCYVCADGKEISIGSLEPQFYAELLARIDAPAEMRGPQPEPKDWAEESERLAAIFRQRTSDEWRGLLDGTDACFAPVIPLQEAPGHPHMAARACYVEQDGLLQAAPAPRLSRTPGAIQQSAQNGRDVVAAWRAAARA
jgi:alpha-methylacyl-CoA racemase